jgi:hypothetical protein
VVQIHPPQPSQDSDSVPNSLKTGRTGAQFCI